MYCHKAPCLTVQAERKRAQTKAHLENQGAQKCVAQAFVEGWNVHVGYQAGQRSVHKLCHEQLEREASLLCTLCVVPEQNVSAKSVRQVYEDACMTSPKPQTCAAMSDRSRSLV